LHDDSKEVLVGTTLDTKLNENTAGVQGDEAEQEIEGKFVAQAEGNETLIGTEPEIELS